MAAKQYVALLRGVNVGGRNKVAMADVRRVRGSRLQIGPHVHQSGNVLFESDAAPTTLERDIEDMLESRFGVPLVVVVRSHGQLRKVVSRLRRIR